MSTIKLTLKANADGTIHLPLPPEFRRGKLNVTATVESAEPRSQHSGLSKLKGFGCLKGKMWMSPDFDEPLIAGKL